MSRSLCVGSAWQNRKGEGDCVDSGGKSHSGSCPFDVFLYTMSATKVKQSLSHSLYLVISI